MLTRSFRCQARSGLVVDRSVPHPCGMSTALLVVDAQESFRQREDWAQISAPDIADRIALLVERARARGDAVVWVLHTEPGTGSFFDPDRGLVRLLPGLDPREGELVLRKTSHNAFTTTNLAQHLTSKGVREVVVTGIRTEQCCETTARVASDLGYAVRFVLDATATHPLPRWDGTGTIGADEVAQRTASALQARFADVVTVADVLAS